MNLHNKLLSLSKEAISNRAYHTVVLSKDTFAKLDKIKKTYNLSANKLINAICDDYLKNHTYYINRIDRGSKWI